MFSPTVTRSFRMKTTFNTMPIKRSFQQYMSTQAGNQEDKPLVIIIAGPTAGKKTGMLILNIIL